MGLPRPALRLLARRFKKEPFAGPLLTLGRQGVLATLEEMRGVLEEEGILPAALPAGMDARTNIPSWRGTWSERYASDVAFFALLGLRDVKALDFSDYEGPDIVCDLNEPVPPELRGRFATVLDGGTLEHVFDVRQALANVSLMLAPGGTVIHIVPVNNQVGHGFYQFSPTLFFDYYKANGFERLEGFLIDETRWLGAWDVYELPESGCARLPQLVSATRLHCVFVARKTVASTSGRAPSQGRYEREYAVEAKTPAAPPAPARWPAPLERFLRRWVLAYDPANRLPLRAREALIRWIPGFDKSAAGWRAQAKPWGLKRVGRLA
jgi:hypothetical protein